MRVQKTSPPEARQNKRCKRLQLLQILRTHTRRVSHSHHVSHHVMSRDECHYYWDHLICPTMIPHTTTTTTTTTLTTTWMVVAVLACGRPRRRFTLSGVRLGNCVARGGGGP